MARSTRADSEQRITRWERSGLSRVEFAQQEGVAPRKLSWWRWKLRRKSATTAIVRRPRVVELQAIAHGASSSERVEIVLENGRVVRVPSAFDDAALRRVLDVAERR